MLDGLNEVLRRRDLYERTQLNEFPLETEARRLARVPNDQLTQAQIERRNRLLFEAAYADQVRKVYGRSWRMVLLIYGAGGLAVALLFWLLVRDQPQDHRNCNEAERALIESGRPPGIGVPVGRPAGCRWFTC